MRETKDQVQEVINEMKGMITRMEILWQKSQDIPDAKVHKVMKGVCEHISEEVMHNLPEVIEARNKLEQDNHVV